MAITWKELGTTEMLLEEDIGVNEVGQRIRELRKARGWTYDEMVRRTGLSRGTLYDAETKKDRRPWYTSLKAIADAFGVTVEYLSEGKLPVGGQSLSEFPPEAYFRARGVKRPAHLRLLSEQLQAVERLETLEPLENDPPAE